MKVKRGAKIAIAGAVVALLVDAVLCFAATPADNLIPNGLVTYAVAARIVAVIVVGACVAAFTRHFANILVATAIGVLLADLAWFRVLYVAASPDALDLVINPLACLVLLTCPVVAADSRKRALSIGILLSVLVPSLVAVWTLVQIREDPPAPGSGLAAALTVIIAFAAMVIGAIGTVLGRLAVEMIQRYSGNPK